MFFKGFAVTEGSILAATVVMYHQAFGWQPFPIRHLQSVIYELGCHTF